MTEPASGPALSQDRPHASLPLWRLLQGSSGVVAAVRAGESATTALERLDTALRPGVQALAFHALRQLGRATALRQQLARRPPGPPVDALLCTALALCWDRTQAPYDAFTLVNQAVEAAKRDNATRKQAPFINACLRRFLREQDALVQATQDDPVARWNHPPWWIERLKLDHPAHWQQILEANNTHAPMTLRINARKSDPRRYLERLASRSIVAAPAGDHGVTLEQPRPVHDIPGFSEGEVSVQDAAAQLAAPLLLQGRTSGLRVLDACAAPGGKTGHLLEMADVEVTALDIAPDRCERIAATLGRLGLQALIVRADAAQPAQWWDGRMFDAILLDAPCTASGIVRRHPDVRWLRRESDIAQLGALQARLLAATWPLLAPGGHLLYCTCSVFRAEGEGQVQTFVAHNTDAVLRPAPGHLMPQTGAMHNGLPDNLEGDHDGFYYALLEKRATDARPGQRV